MAGFHDEDKTSKHRAADVTADNPTFVDKGVTASHRRRRNDCSRHKGHHWPHPPAALEKGLPEGSAEQHHLPMPIVPKARRRTAKAVAPRVADETEPDPRLHVASLRRQRCTHDAIHHVWRQRGQLGGRHADAACGCWPEQSPAWKGCSVRAQPWLGGNHRDRLVRRPSLLGIIHMAGWACVRDGGCRPEVSSDITFATSSASGPICAPLVLHFLANVRLFTPAIVCTRSVEEPAALICSCVRTGRS